jgi:hypothetical protein
MYFEVTGAERASSISRLGTNRHRTLSPSDARPSGQCAHESDLALGTTRARFCTAEQISAVASDAVLADAGRTLVLAPLVVYLCEIVYF